MDTGYSKWRKLDNAALAFPLVTGKNDTRVFRFYCQLKEEVNGEILQAALDQTMEKYPLFQAVLRKGLFWFYLERRDIHAIVKKEKRPPCSSLYIPDQKTLLFQVSYYKNRINFEVYHALTDGTGAMNFLSELVQNYLILAHPSADLPWVEQIEETTPGAQEEDSFSQYYSSDIPGNSEKKPRAVRLPGERLLHEDMHITEIVLPVKELHAKAKEYGVSITILITAMFLCSIHEEIPKSRQNRPIALMVPVNLRNYFPSQSMANFFGWIEVGHDFSQTSDFTEILAHVKEQFAAELVEEKIARHMNSYVRLEKNPVIRAVPLEIKKYFLMLGANLSSRSITAVYSNIGILRFPKEYNQYIDRFGIFASTNSMQLCSCSYENEMVLGFTSKLPKDNIQRNFLNMLKKEEIPYTEKGIIEFLKKLNNDIDGIELVNEYYIDKYCEENGFYELYDDRLKHNYKILSIKYLDPDIKDKSKITYKYTCYAKDGTEFSEIGEERDNIKNIVKKYGVENVKPLALDYIDKLCKTFTSIELKEKFNQLIIDVFETDKDEILLEMDNDYTDI